MADQMSDPTQVLAQVKRPAALTRAGLLAERVVRCFWPLWSVLITVVAALMLGLQDFVAVEAVWAAGLVALGALLWTGWWGARRFRWPTQEAAIMRLDATMPGRPIATALDNQAIGSGDAASQAVWQAHQTRMRARLAEARAVEPDLKTSEQDPYALRYAALLALSVALLFGSVMRVSSVTGMGPGGGSELASGPSWEGWMEPPAYTRLPAVYLNDITDPALSVPAGATVTLRLYGTPGDLSVTETVSGNPLTADTDSADDSAVGARRPRRRTSWLPNRAAWPSTGRAGAPGNLP